MNGAAQVADDEAAEDTFEPVAPEIVYEEVAEEPVETDVEE